uniref:Uncharacterized protein n=1 Tax=Megaselia scalaris TaxID=36166 RepID=T1GN98_MEGSC
RLSTDLADCKSDVINLKRKLKDSEKEVERLKQQLKQYVQEVKKAEDLLMEKICQFLEQFYYIFMLQSVFLFVGRPISLRLTLQYNLHRKKLQSTAFLKPNRFLILSTISSVFSNLGQKASLSRSL